MIPSDYLSIGNYTFYECKDNEVLKVNYDSQLENIGEYAFAYTNYKAITIPASLLAIDYTAFHNIKNHTKYPTD